MEFDLFGNVMFEGVKKEDLIKITDKMINALERCTEIPGYSDKTIYMFLTSKGIINPEVIRFSWFEKQCTKYRKINSQEIDSDSDYFSRLSQWELNKRRFVLLVDSLKENYLAPLHNYVFDKALGDDTGKLAMDYLKNYDRRKTDVSSGSRVKVVCEKDLSSFSIDELQRMLDEEITNG